MDTTQALVLDTAERIFREQVTPALREQAASGEFPQQLWDTLQRQGLLNIAAPEQGLPVSLLFELLQLAGRYAVPLPLAETLLASRWLGVAPEGLISIGSGSSTDLLQVPWGRRATAVLGIASAVPAPGVEAAAAVPIERVSEFKAEALAGGLWLEPVDRVRGVAQGRLEVPGAGVELALSRAALMSGALQTVLDLTLHYARDREQFGRALSKFQAIQHQIAVLAAEVAAAQMATTGAIAELGTPGWSVAVAAAKIRAGEAAGVAAEIAHQVHGAMGFTREHPLHQFTLRLLRWRDEYGHEAEWQRWLGDQLLALGAAQTWDFVAGTGLGGARRRAETDRKGL